jgi:hypothetical protein
MTVQDPYTMKNIITIQFRERDLTQYCISVKRVCSFFVVWSSYCRIDFTQFNTGWLKKIHHHTSYFVNNQSNNSNVDQSDQISVAKPQYETKMYLAQSEGENEAKEDKYCRQ